LHLILYMVKGLQKLQSYFQKENIKKHFVKATVLVAAYWLFSKFFPVYKLPIWGIIYEILWLPMLLLLFAIPIISILLLVKQKEIFTSPFFFTLMISIISLVLLFAL
jgi:hypothetical protein